MFDGYEKKDCVELSVHSESVSDTTRVEAEVCRVSAVKSRDSHVRKLKMAPLAEEHFSSLQLLLKVSHIQLFGINSGTQLESSEGVVCSIMDIRSI